MMLYFYKPSLDAHIAVLKFMPFGTAVPHEIYHGTFRCVFLDSFPNTGEHSLCNNNQGRTTDPKCNRPPPTDFPLSLNPTFSALGKAGMREGVPMSHCHSLRKASLNKLNAVGREVP